MVPTPPIITDGKQNLYLGAQKLNQFVFKHATNLFLLNSLIFLFSDGSNMGFI